MTLNRRVNGHYMHARFSVFQILADGRCGYVRIDTTIDIAVEAFARSVNSAGARIGTVRTVVVTDGRNSVQWTYNEGISYPTEVTVN
jgi:hypothetical protein